MSPRAKKVQRFFAREQRAIARLAHPHIVRLLDFGPGFLVTAFVDGHDLARRLQTPIDPAAAVRYVVQIASALAHAHANGVVHRDVKPSNILIDARENAYLADFGLAAILDDADIASIDRAGTPAFMAPEQARGQVSPAADQYALGRTLLEMLAGGSIAADSSEAVAQLPDSLPRHLLDAVRKATARAPEDRWPSVEAFAAALTEVDLHAYPAPVRLAPEVRVRAPYAWCIAPTAIAPVTPEISRADYRLSDLEKAGLLPAAACAAFREATGYDEIGWSIFGHRTRLGALTNMSSLARATDLVVLLHGMFCARRDWFDVAAEVCRDNAQAIALVPDLYGCGESRFDEPRVRGEHLSQEGTALSVVRFLDLLGVRDLPTVLVGHSLSGAALLSVRDVDLGERVSRVAIVPIFPDDNAFARGTIRAGGALLGALVRVPGVRKLMADSWMTRRDLQTLTEPARARGAAEFDKVTPRLLAQMCSQFAGAAPRPVAELRRCLVIVGDDDPLAPPDRTIAILAARGFPADSVRRLSGNGHHPHYENPEHPELTARCVGDIVRFIDAMLLSSREGSPLTTEVASTLLEGAAATTTSFTPQSTSTLSRPAPPRGSTQSR